MVISDHEDVITTQLSGNILIPCLKQCFLDLVG